MLGKYGLLRACFGGEKEMIFSTQIMSMCFPRGDLGSGTVRGGLSLSWGAWALGGGHLPEIPLKSCFAVGLLGPCGSERDPRHNIFLSVTLPLILLKSSFLFIKNLLILK